MRMAPLNSKARELVRAGRSAYRPTASDRERVEAVLRDRLGADVLPPDGGTAGISGAASWKIVSGVAIGVFALGGAGLLARRAPAARTPSAAPPPITAPAVAPSTPPPALQPTAAGAPAAQHKVAAAPPADARDRLGREVALLSRATSALHAGRPGAALKILAEHQRRFPDGSLREERHAAKAQALCALGRVQEARAELARLPAHSPAAVSAEQLCAER